MAAFFCACSRNRISRLSSISLMTMSAMLFSWFIWLAVMRNRGTVSAIHRTPRTFPFGEINGAPA